MISFSGIDCGGKSTQIEMISESTREVDIPPYLNLQKRL